MADWILLPLAKRLALVLVVVLFCSWFAHSAGYLSDDADGRIRLVLCAVFTLALLLRPKSLLSRAGPAGGRVVAGAIVGTLLALAGLIFKVHQVEWIGVLLLFYAGLRWALPARHADDLKCAVFVLYWVHPLPGQLLAALHLAMQRFSVVGAEWAAHIANTPAWADGLILRTGFRTFEIPQSCSGMRTVTTVLLCSLGTSFLFRLRKPEVVAFAVLGVVQGLLLNIARVSTMVIHASGKPPDWSATFLHDTAGLFLLGAVLLIQLEAALWCKWLRKRWLGWLGQRLAGRPWRFTWAGAFRRIGLRAALLVLALAVAFVGYKRRPAHRAAMIGGVADGLLENDLEAAERAAVAALALADDQTEHHARRARILLLRGKYEQALEALSAVPGVDRDRQYVVMELWALTGAGRTDQAAALLEQLPAAQRDHPGTAMAAAELAAQQGDADGVVRHLSKAAAWPAATERVRRLFPFLAAHGRWAAIVSADRRQPAAYRVPLHFELALAGVMAGGATDRAAGRMRDNRRLWAGDPRYLHHLAELTLHEPAGPWAEEFSSSVTGSLARVSAADLCRYFEPCFSLQRPDLAWLVYLRLRSLDPRHPAVLVVPALFADRWFTFGGPRIASADGPGDKAWDVRPALATLRNREPFRGLWRAIPFASEMADHGTPDAKESLLKAALAELDLAQARGDLPYGEALLYVQALEAGGRMEAAHALLDRTEELYPERRLAILPRRARLFERRGDWERCYETARELAASLRAPAPALATTMVDAMMRLDMGAGALHVAALATREHPASPELWTALASVWASFGHTEEALAALRAGPQPPASPLLMCRLLERTGRHREAEHMREVLGLPPLPDEPAAQPVLPRAERTMQWVAGPELTPAEQSRRARELDARAASAASPFVRDLAALERDWYRDGGRGESADAARWERVGRDPVEQAVSLHKLGLLLAQAGRLRDAMVPVARACLLLPECPIPWRVGIALSSGDLQIANEAYTHCPGDPEVWLAHLVGLVRAGDVEAELMDLVRAAAREGTYSVGTMVRAAEFLLRSGRPDAAAVAARFAVRAAGAYPPAYLVGMQCALAQGDRDWAVSCAVKGAEESRDPLPFTATLVRLKMDGGDAESPALVRSLRQLREREPSRREWIERLGAVYLRRGEPADAWQELQLLVGTPAAETSPAVAILMAEAARQCGEPDKGLRVLRGARAAHPGNASLLNNLVLGLARTGHGLPEARSLLPELLAMAQTPEIYDTAAEVCRRGGSDEDALTYSRQAIAAVAPEAAAWREIYLNAAELNLDLGRSAEARELVRRMEAPAGIRAVGTRDRRTTALVAKLQASDRSERGETETPSAP